MRGSLPKKFVAGSLATLGGVLLSCSLLYCVGKQETSLCEQIARQRHCQSAAQLYEMVPQTTAPQTSAPLGQTPPAHAPPRTSPPYLGASYHGRTVVWGRFPRGVCPGRCPTVDEMLYLKRFAIEELSCNAKISLSTATFPYVTCHFDL